MMNVSLKEKTYVIAGGSKGIGLCLTMRLLAAGASVHIYSRTTGNLPQHQFLTHHKCDFSTDDFASAQLPTAINGAAYCPGTINLRSFRGLTIDDFRADFEVNTIGAIKFLKACQPALKKTGLAQQTLQPSSVVLFSTVAVAVGLPMHASVAVAKGGLEGLTRSLAAEWAPHTRVNCVAPALTETPLSATFFSNDQKRAAMDAKYPLQRAGQPEDLANMAMMLLSPASGWITGQILRIDGGMSSINM